MSERNDGLRTVLDRGEYVAAFRAAKEAFGIAVDDSDMWEFVERLHGHGFTIVEAEAGPRDDGLAVRALLRVIAENGPAVDLDHPEEYGITPHERDAIRALAASDE